MNKIANEIYDENIHLFSKPLEVVLFKLRMEGLITDTPGSD